MSDWALVLEGKTLDRAQARAAMGRLIDGAIGDDETERVLLALKARAPASAEIVGFAEAMRERAVQISVAREPLIDTCGTGGDGSSSFNISTAAAIIAAGAGAFVAKHGNRSVSSRCGSADVLEALGVKASVSPALAARCVEEAGVGFLFAPAHHPGLKRLAPIRKKIGRTIFNLLGPLANPAGAKRQVMGVYSTDLVVVVAEALRELGSEEALVVSSRDGLDEISLSGATVVGHLRKDGHVSCYELAASDFGLAAHGPGVYAGGDAQDNAKILSGIFAGEKSPARDISAVNAAAALVMADRAKDWREGLALAENALDRGWAREALEKLKRLTNAEG